MFDIEALSQASMPKPLVFTEHTAKDLSHFWYRTHCHKRSCLARTCPKHYNLQRFASLQYKVHRYGDDDDDDGGDDDDHSKMKTAA